MINELTRHTIDPFVVLKYDNNQTYKTSIVMANLNPIWNETFEFNLSSEHDKIHMVVNDYDRLSQNDVIGGADITFTGLKRGVVNQVLYSLSHKNDRGTIQLHIIPVDFGTNPSPQDRVLAPHELPTPIQYSAKSNGAGLVVGGILGFVVLGGLGGIVIGSTIGNLVDKNNRFQK
jgi:Ca2+-dependent lipid-binding protein